MWIDRYRPSLNSDFKLTNITVFKHSPLRAPPYPPKYSPYSAASLLICNGVALRNVVDVLYM